MYKVHYLLLLSFNAFNRRSFCKLHFSTYATEPSEFCPSSYVFLRIVHSLLEEFTFLQNIFSVGDFVANTPERILTLLR